VAIESLIADQTTAGLLEWQRLVWAMHA